MPVLLKPNAICSGRVARLWYQALHRAEIDEISMREILHKRHGRVTVIAVGGNSLDGFEDKTVHNIINFRKPVLTHGNGPQVGALMVQYAGSRTLNQCVEETQHTIGQDLKGRLKLAAAEGGRIGKTNYMFSRGDGNWDHNQWSGNGGRGQRGFFTSSGNGNDGSNGVNRQFRDILDGLSNTIAMSERTKGQRGNRKATSGALSISNGGTMRQNPASVLPMLVGGEFPGDFRTWTGTRWPDGAPAFTGCTMILGPNKGSYVQGGWDGEDGIYEPTSKHVGGVQALMGDGAVNFFSENIDTGLTTCPGPDAPGARSGACTPYSQFGRSPFGIWGALGSAGGGEVASF